MKNIYLKQPADLASAGGWFAHVRFNGHNADGLVIQHWVRDMTASEYLEHVHFDRLIEAGRSWEVNDTVLGRPLPLYRSSIYRGGLEIRRPVLAHTRIRLGMEPGDNIRMVSEITHVDHRASLYLFQEIPLDAFTGLYGVDGYVRLRVSRGTRFYLAYLGKGPVEPDEAGAVGFRQRFDQLSDDHRLILLRRIGPPKWDLDLHPPARFHVRKATGSDDWFWLYVAQDSDGDGLIPHGRQATPPALSPYSLPSVALTWGADLQQTDARAVAGEELIRLIKQAHEDNVCLVYPAESLVCSEWRHPDSGASRPWGEFFYKYSWLGDGTTSMVASNENPYAEPLVKMVSGVRNRCHMRVIPVPAQTLTWTRSGDAGGELEPDPSTKTCYYVPAEAPVIEPDYQGKTQRPCTLKQSGFKPVVIDKVLTGTPGNPLYSTFVVLNAQPTHYFKLGFEWGQLRLGLYYRNRGGEEVWVHPENIEWQVLAGGGQVDASGNFEAHFNDDFSVVLAIEKDDRRLYWAVLIVPLRLKSIEEFITMSNKVA